MVLSNEELVERLKGSRAYIKQLKGENKHLRERLLQERSSDPFYTALYVVYAGFLILAAVLITSIANL